VDYNGQAFIGPDQWAPGNGVDAYSRDIKLLETAQTNAQTSLSLTLTNWSSTLQNQLLFSWPGTTPGYVLEVSPRVSPPSWVQTGSPFLDVDGWNKVLLPAPSQTASFYRLRKACDPDLGPRGVGKT
jgi:hypothetical protein